MLTKNPRINVTFEENVAGMITHLAKLEHKSVSGIVRELALEALEMREDIYLSKVAQRLDKEGVKIYTHDEAWK